MARAGLADRSLSGVWDSARFGAQPNARAFITLIDEDDPSPGQGIDQPLARPLPSSQEAVGRFEPFDGG